jgi:hypothetical protein
MQSLAVGISGAENGFGVVVFSQSSKFRLAAKAEKNQTSVPDSAGASEAGFPSKGLMGLTLAPHQGVVD